MEKPEPKTFSTWKYAEEYAFRTMRDGYRVALTMTPNVRHEEEADEHGPGEVYIYHEFHVDVLEKIDDRSSS